MHRMLDALAHPIRTLQTFRPYDYAATGLTRLPENLAGCFPFVERTAPFNPWVPHTGRQDRRFPKTGLLTWDEATLMYNYGLRFSRLRMLEIGCWVGWSTVALGMSGIDLTVIDPVLGGAPQGDACRESSRQAGVTGNVGLVAGYSPAAFADFDPIRTKWSIFFIDGNHEGDAPLRDAQACLRFAEQDSIMLFHDAIQPNVCEALQWVGAQGWNCAMHYTAQFIGVAWRGGLQPLSHQPDPRIDWDRLVKRRWPHCALFPQV